MDHMQPERLQHYLAHELDPAEEQAAAAHLSACPACTELLAQLAAEDDQLTRVLVLDAEDLHWSGQVDLTAAVMAGIEIQPRTVGRDAQVWGSVLVLTLCAAAVLFVEILVNLAALWLNWMGPIGTTVRLGQLAVAAAMNGLQYLARGGLLGSMWPLAVIGMIVWFSRRSSPADSWGRASV